ncbi:MAG TPA: hypothetical protein ENH82_17535 [bacterium]|nr:hypothetical protein [bacterium]
MTEQEKIQNEKDKQRVLELCKEDLIFFGRTVSPAAFELPSPDFHYELTPLLTDRKLLRLAIEAPRGYAKSLLCIFTVLDHLMFDEGNKYVVIQSKTQREAKKRLGAIKNIIEYSPAFRGLFGYMGMQAAKQWREDSITITLPGGASATIEAKGYGQPVRGGLTEDWARVTLYYLDDPEDEDNTKTKNAMDDNLKKFLSALPGLKKKSGKVIVVGTPINQSCLIEKLRKMGGWVFKHYQAVNEKTKEVLWKEMETYDELMREKESLMSVGRLSMWFSEKQCVITGDGDQLFEETDLRWWDGYLETIGEDSYLHITHENRRKSANNNWEMILLAEERVIPVNTYIGVDPASSLRRGADFSTTVPLCHDERKNIYMLPYFEKRVKPTEHARQIQDKFLEIKPKKTYIETVSYQESLRSMMREWMEETENYISGLERKWQPRQDKNDRLFELQRFTKSHRIHLQPGMHRLLDEMLLFPRGNKNILDGLWYATRNLKVPYHTEKDTEDDELKYFLHQTEKKNNWMRV